MLWLIPKEVRSMPTGKIIGFGELENIDESMSSNNKTFWKLKLAGHERPFFCWSRKIIESADPHIGDRLKITHTGGEFAKVLSIEIVKEAVQQKFEGSSGSGSGNGATQPSSGGSRFRSPEQVIRTEALRIAIEAHQPRLSKSWIQCAELVRVADEFAAYITTGKVPKKDKEVSDEGHRKA